MLQNTDVFNKVMLVMLVTCSNQSDCSLVVPNQSIMDSEWLLWLHMSWVDRQSYEMGGQTDNMRWADRHRHEMGK